MLEYYNRGDYMEQQSQQKSEAEVLTEFLGEKQAKKAMKLTSSYDKFVDKFKEDLNAILDPVGYEVKVGIAFFKKEAKKE